MDAVRGGGARLEDVAALLLAGGGAGHRQAGGADQPHHHHHPQHALQQTIEVVWRHCLPVKIGLIQQVRKPDLIFSLQIWLVSWD